MRKGFFVKGTAVFLLVAVLLGGCGPAVDLPEDTDPPATEDTSTPVDELKQYVFAD